MTEKLEFESKEQARAWVSESIRKNQQLEVIIRNNTTKEGATTTMNPSFAIETARTS